MSFFDFIEEFLNSGDPTIREWYLVKSKFWPLFLCLLYLYVVKVAGPAFMKHREPYDLRKTMIIFNSTIVAFYAWGLCMTPYLVAQLDVDDICFELAVATDDNTMRLTYLIWLAYIFKYIELFDTIFFVLRKKDTHISILHVIHHFSLPLFFWILIRTEKSGFQGLQLIINSVIHLFMYLYYGLAAMGSQYRKYIWWKKYLTIAQIGQFVAMLALMTVVQPLVGCHVKPMSIYLNILLAGIFLVLFCNFYRKNYKTTISGADIRDKCKNRIDAVEATKENVATSRRIVQSRN